MAKLRRRRSVDREEAERLLARARILAGYMFVADVDGGPGHDALEAMGPAELRRLALGRRGEPMARQVLAVLDAAGA